MTKQVTFGEKDSELIQKISDFQKMQKLPSFIEAVRVLCEKGLQLKVLNKIVKGKNYETSKKYSSNYAYIGFININDTNNKCKCGKESKTK